MAKGYASASVDFDALFDPDVMGDGPPATGYASNGVALRYAALKYGTKRADVGFRTNGVDVANLWAAKGTAAYSIAGLHGSTFNSFAGSRTSEEGATASVSFSIGNGNGYTVNAGSSSNGSRQLAAGSWNTYGEPAADFDARISLANFNGPAGVSVSNNAPGWVPLSGFAVCSITSTSPGADSNVREGSVSVTVEIRRRSTGQVVSTTQFSISAGSMGYV